MSLKYCLALALLPCAVAAAQAPNAADAGAAVAAASYASAFEHYRSAADAPTTPDQAWHAANEQVKNAGHSMPMTDSMPMTHSMPMTDSMPMNHSMPMTGSTPMTHSMPMTDSTPMTHSMPMPDSMHMPATGSGQPEAKADPHAGH
ncbi:MAG: hypothetical protein ACI83P_002303, partial [Janthinobacterium sp.]